VKVSVVIPAYNAGAHIGRLLLSLAWSRLGPADSLEVVVVDDGSADDTSDVVAGFTAGYSLVSIFLPRTPASGRAAARNAGIEKASGDLVLLLDADQVCAADLVAEHIRYHRLRTDLVVAGPRHDLGEGPFDDAGLARGLTAASIPEVVHRDDREAVLAAFSQNFNNLQTCWHHMFSCNVSVRREHLLAAGGFDEGFTGWGLEDSELGYRLRRADLAFAFNPAAAAYQRHRHVTPDMFTQWRRNLAYFMGRHPGAAEVAAQLVVSRVFDPADRGIGWLESMRRLELAARALAGRLPGPAAFRWIEASHANAAEIRAWLPERAADEDLVVIDDTEEAALADAVQCLDSPRELLYFHRPSGAARDTLRRRYPDRAGHE
jgi:GT2 family glycosyltransferase